MNIPLFSFRVEPVIGPFLSQIRPLITRISVVGLLIVASTLVGCGPEGNSAVEETDEYSFDDVTAQIAAEEAAVSEDDE